MESLGRETWIQSDERRIVARANGSGMGRLRSLDTQMVLAKW